MCQNIFYKTETGLDIIQIMKSIGKIVGIKFNTRFIHNKLTIDFELANYWINRSRKLHIELY